MEGETSAPFAILDEKSLYGEGAEVDNGVNFPPLTVNWSVDNGSNIWRFEYGADRNILL